MIDSRGWQSTERATVVIASSSGVVSSAATNRPRMSIRPGRERESMIGMETDSPGGTFAGYTSTDRGPDM